MAVAAISNVVSFVAVFWALVREISENASVLEPATQQHEHRLSDENHYGFVNVIYDYIVI